MAKIRLCFCTRCGPKTIRLIATTFFDRLLCLGLPMGRWRSDFFPVGPHPNRRSSLRSNLSTSNTDWYRKNGIRFKCARHSISDELRILKQNIVVRKMALKWPRDIIRSSLGHYPNLKLSFFAIYHSVTHSTSLISTSCTPSQVMYIRLRVFLCSWCGSQTRFQLLRVCISLFFLFVNYSCQGLRKERLPTVEMNHK